MLIVKRPKNQDDPYQAPYAVVTDTGAVIKTFDKRKDAFEFQQHILKYPAVQS